MSASLVLSFSLSLVSGLVFLLSSSWSGMPCPCSGLVSKMSCAICANVLGSTVVKFQTFPGSLWWRNSCLQIAPVLKSTRRWGPGRVSMRQANRSTNAIQFHVNDVSGIQRNKLRWATLPSRATPLRMSTNPKSQTELSGPQTHKLTNCKL